MNLWPISEHLQKKSAQKLAPRKNGGLSNSVPVPYLQGNCSSLGNCDQFFRKLPKSSAEYFSRSHKSGDGAKCFIQGCDKDNAFQLD